MMCKLVRSPVVHEWGGGCVWVIKGGETEQYLISHKYRKPFDSTHKCVLNHAIYIAAVIVLELIGQYACVIGPSFKQNNISFIS
jgi:hypothetical protein